MWVNGVPIISSQFYLNHFTVLTHFSEVRFAREWYCAPRSLTFHPHVMTSEKTDGDLRQARALVLRDHPTYQVLLHISRRLKMSPNDVELVRVYTKEIGGKISDTTLPVSSGFDPYC